MPNILHEEKEYKIEETSFGTWRRYGYINGTSFHEFKSHACWGTLPLVHYTYGRNPETGRRVVAKGVLAIGRLACGIIAIGHVSMGMLAIGEAFAAALGSYFAGFIFDILGHYRPAFWMGIVLSIAGILMAGFFKPVNCQ